jgi:hypothetical protein
MEQVHSSFALEDFNVTQILQLGARLRDLGKDARSMEEASGLLVRHLYDNLFSKETGHKACALVRLFKTHDFGELGEDLRRFARERLAGADEKPGIKCLTLLATAGDQSEWNSRAGSKGHQAIPLPNETAINNAPMISQLLREMGLSSGAFVKPDSHLMLDPERTDFNVFHVPEAHGSPYVPSQDFVRASHVNSVLGFGGLLPSRNLFAVIMFSKARISRPTAECFKSLGLMVRMAISPFDPNRVFAQSQSGTGVR